VETSKLTLAINRITKAQNTPKCKTRKDTYNTETETQWTSSKNKNLFTDKEFAEAINFFHYTRGTGPEKNSQTLQETQDPDESAGQDQNHDGVQTFPQDIQPPPELVVRSRPSCQDQGVNRVARKKPSSCVAINYRKPRDTNFTRLQYQKVKLAGTIHNSKEMMGHITIPNGMNFNKQSNGAAYDKMNYDSKKRQAALLRNAATNKPKYKKNQT
jgi:hypothetical protein